MNHSSQFPTGVTAPEAGSAPAGCQRQHLHLPPPPGAGQERDKADTAWLAGREGLPVPGAVRLAPFYLISTPALRAGAAATHSSLQTNSSHTSKMKGSMLSQP